MRLDLVSSLILVGNKVLSYFTINLGYEMRLDLVSNLID